MEQYNSQSEKISFRVQRDFSETFNASFRFMKTNFKSLARVLLFITGPFLLLSAIVTSLYTTNLMGIQNIITGGSAGEFSNLLSKVFSPMYFLTIFAAFLAHIILVGTIYEYMQLYEKEGPGNFGVNEVWQAVKKDFVILAGTFFGIFLIALFAGIIMAFIFGGLFAVSGALGGVAAFLFLIGMLIILFPLMYISTAIYFIRIRERLGFADALKRSMYSMKNNFWWTWLIGLVAYLIIMVAGIIFSLPAGIASFIITLNSGSVNPMGDFSVLMTVLETLSNFMSNILYGVLMIIFGFHYLSLIEEKEGSGMEDKIEEIGDDSGQGLKP